MIQGTCKTNKEPDSIHKQPVSLKEYLICIYYHPFHKDYDKAFERASAYCLSQLKLQYCGDNFIFREYQISYARDLKRIWAKIYLEINKSAAKIKEMHIFSHASKSDGSNDGLEFLSTRDNKNKVIEDGTISYTEISRLEKLRWSINANLILHGCNTGIRGSEPQSIADVFAISQEKCRVHGQRGYAYFSKNLAVYEETTAKDKKIYLLAYKRGKNGYFGNNKRIPALIVEKKK